MSTGERAITIEGLGKRYQLGALGGPLWYGSLRETVTDEAKRQLRRMSGRAPAGAARRGPDHIWALSDVSLTIDQGEVVGIIGPNGAGKSTLLKILSRITRPTSGWAELHGRVGTLLEVGTGFHPELSGRDNVFLSGTILGMRRWEIQQRFDEIVAFAGVDAFIDTPVKRYSSGMYVRLAFAVAAHLDPEILLVDEVLAVGDAEFQKKCLGKLQSVVRGGRTVLFVSHNMAAIKALCPRALLFTGGRLVADGGVDEVVDRYLASDSPRDPQGHVPDTAARVGSGEARVRRVALQDSTGKDIRQLYMGQPFRVVVTVEAMQPLRDVLVGLGISTLDGTRVASWFSTDRGRSTWDLSPGWHRVAVDVDVTLLPRSYTLDCAIVRSTGYDVDTLSRVLDFTALGVAESGSDGYRWSAVRGFVRPEARWQNAETVDEGRLLEAGERHAAGR
ncbi:MAG: ABC transporter ATP-binding protein [Acidobacteriota bacterium]